VHRHFVGSPADLQERGRPPSASNPVPLIPATVKFDPTNLGLGDYVYIIDIADSVEYVSYDSVLFWQETTHTAKMPDGAIPFTTAFGPGKGRLFRIIFPLIPYLQKYIPPWPKNRP